MTLHVYALTEHPAALPQASGIDGAELLAVEIGDIDAVVSAASADPPAASDEAVLAHARVVDELLAANDAVLPSRFANGFRDEAGLRAAVAERAGTLQSALEQVRGNVEIGLRVLSGERRGAAAAGSGRDYLTARLAEVQAAERAADQIHAPLAAAARASTLNVTATAGLLLSGAYLIGRSEVDAFRARVQRLEEEHPELTFVCTGPWPPYSFATVSAGAS